MKRPQPSYQRGCCLRRSQPTASKRHWPLTKAASESADADHHSKSMSCRGSLFSTELRAASSAYRDHVDVATEAEQEQSVGRLYKQRNQPHSVEFHEVTSRAGESLAKPSTNFTVSQRELRTRKPATLGKQPWFQ